jgi:transcriptional regulator
MTYVPRHFEIKDQGGSHRLIEESNFGMLITSGSGVLEVSHLPFVLDKDRGSLGHLRCHVAKANPIWRAIEAGPLLAVFSGPHAYISPHWYPNPNLVPTWNYTAAYVHGRGRLMDGDALDQLLLDLSNAEEARITNKEPWSVADVPETSYAPMRQAIVGIDIEITQIEGKAKMSQNRGKDDQAGVVKGLQGLGTSNALAVAALVEGINA